MISLIKVFIQGQTPFYSINNYSLFMVYIMASSHQQSLSERIAGMRGYLYNNALRLTSDPDNAHDLVQETMVRALKNLDKYHEGNLYNWLLRIQRNLFSSQYRRKEKNVPVDQEEDVLEVPDHQAIRAMNALTNQSLDDRLHDMVLDLPDEYRQVLVLADIEDYTYEMIASALGIPLGTVRSRLFRARAYMRRQMGEKAPDLLVKYRLQEV